MAELPYSGSYMRNAHFASRPPVPGINPEHERPDPDPDPFQPEQGPVQAAAFDVFQPEDVSAHTEMQDRPVSHWGFLQAPVPSNVPSEVSGIAATARMLVNHACVDYRPEQYPVYRHAEQGRTIDETVGRTSAYAGENISDDMAYLVMGTNAYDRTNEPNEVYSGDGANVGRYRLGLTITDFGRYEFHTKQGQDAVLRAYTGLEAQFPVDKPVIENAAPYTPNTSGSAYLTPAFQVPSMFAVPGETALTDYEASTSTEYWGGGGFLEEEGL